jgi:hypothetical protein
MKTNVTKAKEMSSAGGLVSIIYLGIQPLRANVASALNDDCPRVKSNLLRTKRRSVGVFPYYAPKRKIT